ncbi:hypothetical protein AB0H83_41925 [Dactylosporangium sp. NPDC050688]|uniref:hypothetical protein n=1 Tax=Dactylosporangium sp. NPDC050688 TaxID=3157217 RepID=UPI003410E62F
MAPPEKIVINDDFIKKVANNLSTFETELGRVLNGSGPPYLNSLTVAAGADGYAQGTALESAVSSAGTAVHTHLSSLRTSLLNQWTNLDRMLEVTDEVEALNTQEPSSIVEWLDTGLFTPPATPTPPVVPPAKQ